MKRLTAACTAVAAAGAFGLTVLSAHAQGSATQESYRMMRPTVGMRRDITRSAEPLLLGRVDVRKELMMSGRQQVQADELIEQQQHELISKQVEALQQMRRTMRPELQSLGAAPPEQRRALLQEANAQVEKQIEPTLEAQVKRLEALLTPGQVTRLRQLDLQWRGGLALGDAKLAAKLDLTEEQNHNVGAILQEYHTALTDLERAVRAPGLDRSAGLGTPHQTPDLGGAPQSGLVQSDAGVNSAPGKGQQGNNLLPHLGSLRESIQARMQAARTTADRLCKAEGHKIVLLLTPFQKQRWAALQGKPFAFEPGDSSPQSDDE